MNKGVIDFSILFLYWLCIRLDIRFGLECCYFLRKLVVFIMYDKWGFFCFFEISGKFLGWGVELIFGGNISFGL